MKPVSDKFKKHINQYGRQIDVLITYTLEGEEHILDSDMLFSVTPCVNGNILKSVMKQLEFESSIKVPKGTIINFKFGVLEDLSLTVSEINKMKVNRLNILPVKFLSKDLKGFEYIDFGNYEVAEEPEYNADTLSYSHLCYDKMLRSMKDYEELNITYPITVRSYINKICECLGLEFKNKNDVFANYNRQIKEDLYKGYDYKFRDVLDELAQTTASTICINESTDELEIRYIQETNDKINEDYLKDSNVEFSGKYGPINSIVLSRSAESDNVYLLDEESVEENGLCELKIVDNQIMNDNDRSDFLPDILEKLNGLEYYINDFESTGITYYELCDKYTVEIEEKLYNCVLFNDEIKITQGLEESIYTEMPEVSETDYSKADKDDRKMNKAYIMLDKQNKKIEELLQETTENTEKIAKLIIDVNGVTIEVSAKVGEDEIISKINSSSEGIVIQANKVDIIGKKVKFTTNIEGNYTFTQSDLDKIVAYIMGNGTLTSAEKELYDINKDGMVRATDYVKIKNAINNNNGTINVTGTFEIDPDSAKRSLILRDSSGNIITSVGLLGMQTQSLGAERIESIDATFQNLTVEGTFANNSDKRLKTDIVELDDKYTNLIKDIDPVVFTYKKSNQRHIGFIAQDVEQAFNKEHIEPTLIKKDDLGIYSLDYIQLIGILWKDNKSKNELIEDLKLRIENLEKEVNK